MDSAGTTIAERPTEAAPPTAPALGLRRYGAGTLFLLPALAVLGVWIVYPTIYTIVRSFYGESGFGDFVGLANYRTLFTTSTLVTAIKNSAIWVACAGKWDGPMHR